MSRKKVSMEDAQRGAWEIGVQNGSPNTRIFKAKQLQRRLEISEPTVYIYIQSLIKNSLVEKTDEGYLVHEPVPASEKKFEIVSPVREGMKSLVVTPPTVTKKRRVDSMNEMFRERVNFFKENTLVGVNQFVGCSQVTRKIRERIRKASTPVGSAKLPPVLITGESGTGKELVAKAVHELSPRRIHELHSVNCAAIPTALLESELFGHEKGAFTGAISRRPGIFEIAKGSTIFLDEIGDTEPEFQVKVLRVLQDGTFRVVGNWTLIKTDARIIAATNKDLPKAITEGKFREDLYHRLKVFPISIPPLRDRREDILEILALYTADFELESKLEYTFTDEAFALLYHYDWPGNARELYNVIRRAFIEEQGTKRITDGSLWFD